MKQIVLLCGALLVMCGCTGYHPPRVDVPHRRELTHAAPEAVGVDSRHLAKAGAIVQEVVDNGKIPGGVLLVGKSHAIIFEHAYGKRVLGEHPEKMTDNTLFDMASISKPVSTAAAVMLLYDQGKVDVNAPACRYLPELDVPGKREITVRHLMTHTSGFPPGIYIPRLEKENGPGPDPAAYYRAVSTCPLRGKPGTKYIYSDVNYAELAHLAALVSGMRMDDYLRRRLWNPLDMDSTYYRVPWRMLRRTAPNKPPGKGRRGWVHDPTARYLEDGYACGGNAGLFTTAEDLAHYARLLLNGGTWNGMQLFSPGAVELMTTRQTPVAPRSLGWGVRYDKDDPKHVVAIAHSGWTGTWMYVNFEHQDYVIYLTNRTHSKDDADHAGRKVPAVMDAVCAALGHEW